MRTIALLSLALLGLAACSGSTTSEAPADTGASPEDATLTDISGAPDGEAPDAKLPPSPDTVADTASVTDTVTDSATVTDSVTDTATVPDSATASDSVTGADTAPDAAAPTGCEGWESPFTTAPDLYDMAFLTDPSTLDIEILSTTTGGLPPVRVQEIRYTSYEVEDCTIRPVRIEAYIGVPTLSGDNLPGLVVAHGLGGSADANAASGPARDHGVVALAYSGPGQGASEGTGSVPDHLFDTLPDPRASWFWEHSVAAIRGLTVLATLPEVDADRLGMTGYSGGAVATYMVNGVDERLVLAAPVSACGYLDLAATATPVPGWEADLLAAMTPPRDPSSPEFAAYETWLDPKRFLPTAQAPMFIIDGAQDEFFPIDSLTWTFDDLRANSDAHRLLVIKDWDHGWYALFTGEEAAEISAGALHYVFRQGFGLHAAYAARVPMPQIDALIPWICLVDGVVPYDCAAAQASFEGEIDYAVQSARLNWSADGSLTYQSWNLQEDGSVWRAEVGTLDGNLVDELVYWVDFELRPTLLGPSLWVSSRPHIPADFVPNILPIDGPLP